MSVFDVAMKTKSMRKASRIFAESLELTDRKAMDFTEVVFIAGAGWAWEQMRQGIVKQRDDAKDLCDSNSVMQASKK